jgi:hypothetical protein
VATDLIREEYGAASQRGRATSVVKDGVTHPILRDARGRVVGLGGRSRVDDLVDAAAGLAGRVEQLEANPADTEAVVEAVADCAEVVTEAEGRIAERVAGIAPAIASHGDNLADSARVLDGRAAALQASALRIEGWRPGAGNALWVHARNVGTVASRLGISWPVTISWMTPEQRARIDKHYGAVVAGYRQASSTKEHTIVLRKGRKASDTAQTLRHELVHCGQVERLLDKFDETYLCDGGKALEAEACETAASAEHLELVRSL